MRDLNLWQFIAAALEQGERVMLLVVVDHTPGSPGRQGFKMAVTSQGRRAGTIGGGVMEFRLVEQATKQLSRDDETLHWLPQLHTKAARRWRSGMICAGGQIVVMCPLAPAHLPKAQDVVTCLQAGEPLALHLSAQGGLAFSRPSSEVVKYHYNEQVAGEWRYEERLGPEAYVSIVGGGHVGLALSRVMATLDVHMTVFDHRGDLDTLLANTYAHRVIVGPYEAMVPHVHQGSQAYAAIVSTSFKTDEAALRQLVGLDLRYLGVMGSAAKIQHLFAVLANDGFPAAQLDRVHAPIGLAINSRTTEEIAISIAGEIIAFKNSPEQSAARSTHARCGALYTGVRQNRGCDDAMQS